MSRFERINPSRGRSRRRFTAVLPWLFVAAVAVASALPLRHRLPWPRQIDDSPAARDAAMIVDHAGSPSTRYAVDVIRTVDGDTFEARVHVQSGLDPVTRVRLRGIDAPELKAACPEELRMAEAASAALRRLLGEGGVTISNIGADKYSGRVLADVSTGRTGNVSAALLAAGHARSYHGGHRKGWCANAGK